MASKTGFPILLSLPLLALFIFGLCTIGALEHDIKLIAKKMGFEVKVTINALYFLFSGTIVALLVASSVMAYLLFNHS